MELHKIDVGLGGGSLLQIATRTLTPMMSYIIDTPNGEVIVIDGGNYCPEDADYLHEQLLLRGGHVKMWVITHAHPDHLGAITYMLCEYPEFDIVIDKLMFHFPPTEWLRTRGFFELNSKFLQAVEAHQLNVVTIHGGDTYECDGISVEFINDPIIQDRFKGINPTCVLTVVHFPKRDVLFLADFNAAAEGEFLQKYDVAKIRKDIVQMSHHGQRGVSRAFYELIQPKICLYTTPIWLWENNYEECLDPETRGKGPYATLETRQWMEELGVEMSCVHAFGDYILY